jgi:primosomal protein N' (replication factor Y)
VGETMIAKVIIDIKHEQVNKLYDYFIPDHLEGMIERGMRVIVPFNTQQRVGYVLDVQKESIEATKSIIDVIESEPIIDDEMFQIIDLIKSMNHGLDANLIELVIPTDRLMHYQKIVTILDRGNLPDTWKKKRTSWILSKKDAKDTLLIKKLKRENVITISTQIKTRQKTKTQNNYTYNPNHQYVHIARYQDQLTSDLNQPWSKKDLLDQGLTDSNIRTLIKNGVLFEKEVEVFRDIKHQTIPSKKLIKLNSEQQNAYQSIHQALGNHQVFLLKGITGSGKTEIYLRLIKDVIDQGKQVMILVPEIALIAPMAHQLKSWFERVAIYHSWLSPGQRHDQMKSIMNHEADILLGTRSACFLTFSQLGLILMDEEHDASYKQTEGIYYDTRSILKRRADYHQIPLVMGSATPSIETMYEAKNGTYQLLELTQRPNHIPMPKVHFVDMKEELKRGNSKIISKLLEEKINDRLKKKEQVILLINRKGYAPFVMCRACGDVPMCPDCDISLTYYKDKNVLKCHYCGYEKPFLKTCEVCKEDKVSEFGLGIDHVYQTISHLFPKARLLQMDKNMIKTKDAHEIIWKEFTDHQADILIGTQMISKGMDFPKVTLVGILDVDQLLKIPSYQASERAYMLLTQTIGRSGRIMDGEAVIQGYHLSHFAVMAIYKPYDKFYEEALYERKIGRYFPFYQNAQILFEGLSYLKTYQHAFTVKKALEKEGIDAYGPSPAIRKKIKDHYRFTLTLKFKDQPFSEIIGLLNPFYHHEINVRFYPHLDVF